MRQEKREYDVGNRATTILPSSGTGSVGDANYPVLEGE